MRIVAGIWRGRALVTPEGFKTRPTADRVRESIFNVLTHNKWGFALSGAVVLDAFCGSGALAFEALSRGAARAVLTDQDLSALKAADTNKKALGADAEIVRHAWPRGYHTAEKFTLVFLDPPYAEKNLVPDTLHVLRKNVGLGTLAVIEQAAGSAVVLPEGWVGLDVRRYGSTQIVFARFSENRE